MGVLVFSLYDIISEKNVIKNLKSYDGKVVMVVQENGGTLYKSRATCDLENDIFDLDVGIRIAEGRAFYKVVKANQKTYQKLADFALAVYQDYIKELEKLAKMIK